MRNIKKIFTHSRAFWIVALALLNMTYISIEIYKSEFTKPLIDKTHITEAESSKFETLSNYAYYFEAAFIIVSIVWTLLMFSKKYKPSFKEAIVAQLTLLIGLYIVNSILSGVFDAPIGNLTQLLWGPIVYVVVAVVYYVLSRLLFKIKRQRNTDTLKGY